MKGLDDYSRIEPEYVKPYDEILAGKQNATPEEYRGSNKFCNQIIDGLKFII